MQDYSYSLLVYSNLTPLSANSLSAGTRTVAFDCKGHAGPVTESPSDRGALNAHNGVISDPYVG